MYTYLDSKLLAPVVYFADLVYGPFGECNMHSTLDFCPRPTWKEINVPLYNRAYCPNIYIYIVLWPDFSACEMIRISKTLHDCGGQVKVQLMLDNANCYLLTTK